MTQPSGKIRSYLRNFIGAIKLAKEDDQIIYKQNLTLEGLLKGKVGSATTSSISNTTMQISNKKTMSNSQTGESEIFEYIYGTDQILTA